MSVGEVGKQIASILGQSASLFFKAGDDYSRELTLGQIIKGKVLRSYEGGRYQVDFSGQQKTVDSAVPLKTGELIHGRVIGVGDQIEIKRLAADGHADANNAVAKNSPGLLLASKWEALLVQGMRDYHVKFNAQQRADVIKVMKQVAVPQQVLLSAAAMAKQNIGFNQELLLLLNKIQSKQERLSLFDVEQRVLQLAAENGALDSGIQASGVEAVVDTNEMQNSLHNLAVLIRQLVTEQETKARQTDSAASAPAEQESSETLNIAEKTVAQELHNQDYLKQQKDAFTTVWHLLNQQVDGAVQHRVTTLPVWVGEQLVEVDVVMYEQRQQGRQLAQQINSIDNKKIMLSLDLEMLGHVDVEIQLNNKHLKMAISTDSAANTQQLLAHGVELSENIGEQNWSLDEMSYLTKNKDKMGNVVASILEHYAAQDSLSRLM